MAVNRMERILGEMKQAGEKILVAYYPLCDPLLDDPVAWAGKYFENGATVLEMGLPYENPCLDGKIVRESMERALTKHTVDDAFDVIAELRQAYPNNILQVMTYFEIIDKMGIENFAKRCAECGADGVLTPNIPQSRVAELDRALGAYHLLQLRFAPFHLSGDAINDLKANAKGYIFLQAVDGATGPQEKTSPQVGENVKTLKQSGIGTPVVAGFGISNAQHVREMKAMGADGVIVGSKIISEIQNGNGEEFIRQLRSALQ